MSILETLEKLIFSRTESDPVLTQEQGICPNCWGRAEYGGKFYETIKNDKVGTMHSSSRLGWIQEYVNTHLSKILLKKADHGDLVCGQCTVSYRPEV